MSQPELKSVIEAMIDPVVEAISTPPPDPFDLNALRLEQSFVESAGVKKLVTTIPVRKPNSQDFYRVHPSPDYRATFAVIVLKEDGEIYLLPPNIAKELPGEFVMMTLFAAINRQGVLFLWPARLPDSEGPQLDWWRSMREAATLAMETWVRVKANKSLGAYEMWPAKPEAYQDPVWPDLPFQEMIRIAFKDRFVDRLDHPLIKRLRGE